MTATVLHIPIHAPAAPGLAGPRPCLAQCLHAWACCAAVAVQHSHAQWQVVHFHHRYLRELSTKLVDACYCHESIDRHQIVVNRYDLCAVAGPNQPCGSDRCSSCKQQGPSFRNKYE